MWCQDERRQLSLGIWRACGAPHITNLFPKKMRQRGRRKIGYKFQDLYYKPRGIMLRDLQEVQISKEDLETLRLKYIEKLTQEDAATKMGISQSQYQRDISKILEKLTEALIEGKAIHISE